LSLCIVRDSSQLLAFCEAIDDFYETTAGFQEATGHSQVMTSDFSVTTGISTR